MLLISSQAFILVVVITLRIYTCSEIFQLIDSIPSLMDYSISVLSHTDNIGGVAYNEWLSQMRSNAVIQELVNEDFSENQIEIRDFGQFNPVFDNSTIEGRMMNRRVDDIFT